MKRWHTLFVALAALLMLIALPSVAQLNSSVRGGLGGVVFDSTGSVLPNADVTIVGPQGTYAVKTDTSGHYAVTGLVPGSYSVKVEVPGFKTYLSERNLVVAGSTSSLDVHLEVGEVSDTVQVEAGAVQIDTQTTALNTPLTDQLYQSLPVARNVAAIFTLAPGVVSGGGTGTSNPSIGGASGLENLYMVDGVTITDQAFGGLGTYNRYFGSLGSGINLAFIKEVDVKTAAFEPRYGRAAGGIVEIVTKSGSNTYHGAIAAYLGPGAWYADRYQLNQFNYILTANPSILSNPQYDVSAELGGYVPHFKDKMFFFGAFDPSLIQNINEAQQGLPLYSHGPYAFSTTTLSWAGKITYLPFANTQLEASSFGDPSHHNVYPVTLAAQNADSVAGRYNYGSVDSVVRLNQTISPTWLLSLSYTYNYNKFNFLPKLNNYQIQDRTVNPYITYGVGGYEPTKNDDYSINLETEKRVHFLGDHTLSIGYTYDHTNFVDLPSRTGALFAIPGANADGKQLSALYTGFKTSAVGQMTNSTFRLRSTTPAGVTTPYTGCTYCGTLANGQQVYLQQIRGTYKGLNVLARGRYHVAFANDSYQMNRYINIDAGLRWEEQWYDGTLMKYLFNDNWSPRIGLNIDPFGDRKSKVYFNYARYQSVLPLDAAIRQLGNEQDDTSYFFAPKTDGTSHVVFDSTGSAIPLVDATHTLNGTVQSVVTDPTTHAVTTTKFGAPSFASSTGEGILPKTRMEYENEYVIGIQREIISGSVLSVRYSDRRLGRIVEDIGSQSPEDGITGLAGNYVGGIANVNAATDIAVNENTIVYTPQQWATANPNAPTPGSATAPGTGKPTDYNPPVPGCTYANDFAVANGDFFRQYNGTPYNSGCILNAATADDGPGDGKPDGFANPVRRYQEVIVEFNRNLKNNWQARINYRYARLWGNYEGFYRNDNGQSDPGISSLFDFTSGKLNLLGDQFKAGFLNTDRRHVGNLDIAYVISSSTPWISGLKKMTLGANLRGSTGNPLSALASHPVYLNTGEVPIGGRGTKGTLPTTLQLDMHADYPMQVKEKYTLKFPFDAFNVTNSQFETGKNQNLDTSPGVSSPDYGKPASFQGPFYARASIRVEF